MRTFLKTLGFLAAIVVGAFLAGVTAIFGVKAGGAPGSMWPWSGNDEWFGAWIVAPYGWVAGLIVSILAFIAASRWGYAGRIKAALFVPAAVIFIVAFVWFTCWAHIQRQDAKLLVPRDLAW